MTEDSYLVPNLKSNEIHRTEITVKKSRVITSIGRTHGVDEAKAFIIDTLKAGEMPVRELDTLANAIGISKKTLRNARKELKDNGEICFRKEGHGKGNGTTTYISLQNENSLLYKNCLHSNKSCLVISIFKLG